MGRHALWSVSLDPPNEAEVRTALALLMHHNVSEQDGFPLACVRSKIRYSERAHACIPQSIGQGKNLWIGWGIVKNGS